LVADKETWADERLGPLNQTMRQFADQHEIKLEPRYVDQSAAWSFSWSDGPLMRKIGLVIRETPKFIDVIIHSMAWHDFPGDRLFTGHPRSFTLRLQVSEQLFLQTLEWAFADAQSIDIPRPV